MESALAWCRSDGASVPKEVRDLLESNPQTRGVKLSDGEPEKGIVFDRAGGEPRNADVALLGTDSRGDIVAITIEAKADESFGPTFQQAVAASVERMCQANLRTGEPSQARPACCLRRVGGPFPTRSERPARPSQYSCSPQWPERWRSRISRTQLAIFIVHSS
jgi:hypothetical protein